MAHYRTINTIQDWFDLLFQTVDQIYNGLESDSLITHIRRNNPYNAIGAFPPCDVSINTETKQLRYEFALAGIDPDNVSLQFEDDYLILNIDQKEEKSDQWEVLKRGIKRHIEGRYKYSVPTSRYDITKTEASWHQGLLIVTIPLKEDRKPLKINIKNALLDK